MYNIALIVMRLFIISTMTSWQLVNIHGSIFCSSCKKGERVGRRVQEMREWEGNVMSDFPSRRLIKKLKRKRVYENSFRIF